MRAGESSLAFLDVFLERAERGVPERADFLELADQLGDRLSSARGQLVNPFAPALARSDEPGAPQHPRMLHDRRPAHRESARQLARAAWFAREAMQQFAAGRIGEGEDGGVNRHLLDM